MGGKVIFKSTSLIYHASLRLERDVEELFSHKDEYTYLCEMK